MAVEPLPSGDGSPPRRVGQGLGRVVRHLGAPDVDSVTTLFARWDEVVGAQVAGHCRPLALREQTLVLAVEDPAWASQLRWLEADLVRTLEERLGPGRVTGVEVRVRGSGQRSPDERGDRR